MTEAAHVELNRVIEALTGEFADVFAPEAVAACVLDGRQALEPARVATSSRC